MRNSILYRLIPIITVVALYVVLSCGSDTQGPMGPDDGNGEPEVDTIAPRVASTTPGSGAINIMRSTIIEAYFSEPLDPASINDSIFIIDDTVFGSVSHNGNTIGITITEKLGINTLVRPKIKGTIRDTAGNLMGDDYEWIFRTSPSFTVADLVGDYIGIYSIGDFYVKPNHIFHQKILWTFTDSTFSMQIDTSAVFDTTAPTCRVSGTFILDDHDLHFEVLESSADSAAGFDSCLTRWHPDGIFNLYRITAYTEMVEFSQIDTLRKIDKNIRIDKIPVGQ